MLDRLTWESNRPYQILSIRFLIMHFSNEAVMKMQKRRKIDSTVDQYCSKTRLWTLLIVLMIISGCSVKQLAINQLGDLLASESLVYAADNDIELVAGALPFGLKTIESLLAQSPNHQGLLLAACRGFTQYAYAFVELPADQLSVVDFRQSQLQRLRAGRLYLRARDYGLKGLDVTRQALLKSISEQGNLLSGKNTRNYLDLLYWTATAWAGAIGIQKDKDPMLLADLPIVYALIDQAITVDEDYEDGALHGLLLALSMSRPGHREVNAALAKRHFDRAVSLSKGLNAAPYVSYATAVAILQQEKVLFQQMLNKALLINPNQSPAYSLSNHLMQKYAHWLLDHSDLYFPETQGD